MNVIISFQSHLLYTTSVSFSEKTNEKDAGYIYGWWRNHDEMFSTRDETTEECPYQECEAENGENESTTHSDEVDTDYVHGLTRLHATSVEANGEESDECQYWCPSKCLP